MSDEQHVRSFDLTQKPLRPLQRVVTTDVARFCAERQLVADGHAVLCASGGLNLALFPLGPGGPGWQAEGPLNVALPGGRLPYETQATLRAFVEALREVAKGESAGFGTVAATPLAFAIEDGGWGHGGAIDRSGERLAAIAGDRVLLLDFGETVTEASNRPDLLVIQRPFPDSVPGMDAIWPVVPPDALQFDAPGALLVAYYELMPPYCYECDGYGYPSGLWLWDAESGEPILQAVMPGMGTPVAFGASRLAAATGLWDTRTGEKLCGWPPATAVAIGPLIAVGDREGKVRLLDPETCAYLAPLPGHTDRIEELAFDPSGRWLASRSRDGSVRLWPIVPRE